MNCPNCGREMAFGYLSSGGYRILWTEQERKFSNLPGTADVVIQPFTLTGKNQIKAYHCGYCRKIVADY